ncbi:HCOMODA/2-hydroxy-3-carboxy-muconic semialdehyde decarboxylase [Tistlia consotensis]|uniref:HCOMODA/2-hydroxy-3-carboxy-muconic semialdehyde decarboxylase n=1 Tax=Tistlia consotensis USBA 355 TaxID=560819 RepID=A0A1Y6CLH0_9PROT|nr:class II aldolase/adducin family protein [Tistlia consotensis]SMF75560.1 HCOMODA/2-hydroxy-3-carboxy-muconic semialdehyde decarboxylase [Tistlia consotensis USBA 355]SNS07850.1 HCOMODA/2-hydroxy-3-carboxy-muconic semialdehyde decarboxylase [Tistlia consotensis]
MCDRLQDDGSRGGASASAEDRGRPAPPADPALLDDLVAANRILARHGVVDAFGHVSVRHDKAPDRFLLSRNMAPGLVTGADIVEFDLDGTPVDAAGRRVYLERFLHGEIYRSRPDVQAVVHSHAPDLLPFGIVEGLALRPVWHMAGFLGDFARDGAGGGGGGEAGLPVFEIRETAGPASDLLIRDNALGRALAESLGGAPVALMRGHGATLVGESLAIAVFRSVYTKMNADVLLRALPFGPVTYLTAGEAAATTATNSGQVQRAWELWKREAGAPEG